MAPLANKITFDPKLLVSKGLDASNFKSQEDQKVLAKIQAEAKKKQAQKAVSTVITKGITSGAGVNAPAVPTVIKTPVQQTNRSTEIPAPTAPTPNTFPNGQPIIAGNVSPQSLQPQQESNFVSKERLKQVLDQVPQDRKHIVLRAIIAKGKIVEGYNDPQSQIKQAPVPVAPQITYGENKIQDQKQPGSLRRGIASLGGDMGNLEWLNPVGKVFENVDNAIQKIPVVTKDNVANAFNKLVPGFGDSIIEGGGPNVIQMLANVPGSLLKTTSATARGVTNPVDTMQGLYKLVATDEGHQVIKDRYGSMDNFAKSMDQDPVGVASDILTVVQGGATLGSKAAGLAGKAELAGKLSGIANTAGGAADLGLGVGMNKLNAGIGNIASNPLRIAAKTLLAPTQPLTAGKEVLGIGQPKQVPVDRSNIDIKQPKDIVLTPQIEDKIQRSIKPTVIEKKGSKVLDKFNKDVVSSIDTVLQYLPQIKLKDADGNIVDRPIETIRDFGDSIDQAKTMVFKEYDALKKQAGEQGVEVSLDGSIKELNKAKEGLKGLPGQKQVISYIDEQIADLSEIKKLSVDNSQKALQIYNEKLTAYYKNPQPNDVGKASIDALIANTIRQEMNNLIEGATGSPAYKVLKERYGSLTNVEKEVMKRAIVSGRGNAKSLLDFTDMFTADQAISAIVNLATGNIAGAVKSGASAIFINSIKNFYKNINSPDKNIKDLFDIVNNKRDQIFTNKKSLNDNTMSDNIGVVPKNTLGDTERSKGGLQQNGLDNKPGNTLDMIKESVKKKPQNPLKTLAKSTQTKIEPKKVVLYRGTNKGGVKKFGFDAYTDDQNVARSYGSDVSSVEITPKKLADFSNPTDDILQVIKDNRKGGEYYDLERLRKLATKEKMGGTDFYEIFDDQNVIKALKDKGYDYVKFNDFAGAKGEFKKHTTYFKLI